MSASRPARTAASVYRAFLIAGFDPVTAGNLTGIRVGLPPTAQGWRPAEIERLLFLAWLDRTGRLERSRIRASLPTSSR